MTLQKCTKINQHNPSIKLGRESYAKATNMPSTLQPVPKQKQPSKCSRGSLQLLQTHLKPGVVEQCIGKSPSLWWPGLLHFILNLFLIRGLSATRVNVGGSFCHYNVNLLSKLLTPFIKSQRQNDNSPIKIGIATYINTEFEKPLERNIVKLFMRYPKPEII